MKLLPRLVLGVSFVLAVAGCGSAEPAGDPPASTSATAATATVPPSAPATSTGAVATDDAAAVRAAFDTYKKAALAKDGESAVAVMAAPIFSFYDETRRDALSATKAQLTSRPVTRQLTAYILRAEVAPGVLRTGSVEQILRVAFEKGLVGEDGIRNLDLGKVEVDGDRASGAAVVQGQTAPLSLAFLREDGRWKIDIKPLLDVADTTFTNQAKQQGVSPSALVDQVLLAKYGREKAQRLYTPLGR